MMVIQKKGKKKKEGVDAARLDSRKEREKKEKQQREGEVQIERI